MPRRFGSAGLFVAGCRRVGILSLVVLLALPALSAPAADDGLPIFRLRVQVDSAGLQWLAAEGFDIAGRDLEAGWVEVIAGAAEFERLQARGLDYELFERRDRRLPLGRTRVAAEPDGSQRAPTDPLGDLAYTDWAEAQAWLQQVAADHPAIVRLETIGTSVQGREILAMMISDHADQDEDELSLLFTGTHHSREVMTPEVVLDTIDQLTDQYGTDPRITAIVDAYEIWCVPVVNPDGLEVVFVEDELWRKNAADHDENGRVTWKDGVDINRNYEWGWGNQCLGSADGETQATYRGPYEASEPETRAMIELGRRIRPVIYVEYHSYGEDVFYAMGCDPQFSPRLSTIEGPDQNVGRVIAEEYGSRIVQADGELGFVAAPYGSRVDGIGRDHHAHESGSVAFVTELNSGAEGGFAPDHATWRDATVVGQREAWLWLIERTAGPAVGGVVTDAVSGQPLVADVSLDQLTHPDGRRLTSRPDTGRFHILVVPGDYTLRVRAPGYQDAVVPLTVGATWQSSDVALQPDGSELLVGEDFEDAARIANWVAGPPEDTASAGAWEWGEPHGSHLGDLPSGTLQFGNPALDQTGGLGGNAFVSGNAPAAGFDVDDVDEGQVSLLSPPWDLAGSYAVDLEFRLWLAKDPTDPVDAFEVDVTVDDGQSWSSLAVAVDSTSTPVASPAWVAVQARIDDVVSPGPQTRLRFRVSDEGLDNVVEAAVDELSIRGYSLEEQGLIGDLIFPDPGATVWTPVPGGSAATYEIVRGDLDALSGDAVAVDLGLLTCVDAAAGATASLGAESPVSGTGWFYLTRFRLGYSVGPWGAAGDGRPRLGSAGCP